MQADTISLSPAAAAKMQLRAYFNRYTCRPTGTPLDDWQRNLTELDPELHLRWSYIKHCWSVWYDHHGQLTCVASFGPDESFGQVLQNLRVNAWLTTRRLRQMKADEEAAIEKEADDAIVEAAEEFGTELHHATRERVINDGVDVFGPPKPKLGGVIL
jgi:hypothetical protein